MWFASFRTAPLTMHQSSGPGTSSLNMMVAAASPRFSPRRSLSKGLQASSESALKDWNPDIMNLLCTSEPDTITVEYLPERICLMAAIWAERPEIQAFETTTGVFLLPKNPAILPAETPRRSPGGTDPARTPSRSSTLPLVEEMMKSTSGPAGSTPVPSKALETDRMILLSNLVYPLPMPREAYSRSRVESSIRDAKYASGSPSVASLLERADSPALTLR